MTGARLKTLVGNLVIYRSVVGARLGHGWGTNLKFKGHGWGKVGASSFVLGEVELFIFPAIGILDGPTCLLQLDRLVP